MAARAYLSTGADRLRGIDGYRHDYEQAALAEAERILADAEPPTRRVHVYRGLSGLVRATATSVNGITAAGFILAAREALAEALATFIESEVS